VVLDSFEASTKMIRQNNSWQIIILKIINTTNCESTESRNNIELNSGNKKELEHFSFVLTYEKTPPEVPYHQVKWYEPRAR
jgi:hypothetical protein